MNALNGHGLERKRERARARKLPRNKSDFLFVYKIFICVLLDERKRDICIDVG